MPIRRISLTLIVILLLSGCVSTETTLQIHNDTKADVEKLEEILLTHPNLTHAVAVFHNQHLVSGLNLKTFSRWHKEKIEKEIQSIVEESYPEFDVTVSADMKVLRETTKLLEEDNAEKMTEKLEKLKALLREET